MKTIKEKYSTLQKILRKLDKVIIAFSGGVDSTLLAKVAFDTLKDNAIAITLASPQLPNEELSEAEEIAKYIGIKHYIIQEQMENTWFENNPPDRCYICKKETLLLIDRFCKKKQIKGQLIEGSNFDDLNDYRPGFKAVKEQNVKSPLLDAQLSKEDIRSISRELGIPCWDKPASPCLATRFLFGEKITKEKLNMVSEAEKFLRVLGIKLVRVRVHQNTARIETSEEFFSLVINNYESITDKLKSVGFEFVTLDLSGYKRGSMNRINNLKSSEE